MKKQVVLLLLIAMVSLSGIAMATNRTNIDDNNAVQHVEKKTDMKNMKMGKMNPADSTNSIIRKGVINVEALDKNKDGKLYEDVMDWNVISDKPGKCPICGMKLRELTIQQVKKNLKDHGFKYKE